MRLLDKLGEGVAEGMSRAFQAEERLPANLGGERWGIGMVGCSKSKRVDGVTGVGRSGPLWVWKGPWMSPEGTGEPGTGGVG